jgi:hypothetical protein
LTICRQKEDAEALSVEQMQQMYESEVERRGLAGDRNLEYQHTGGV